MTTNSRTPVTRTLKGNEKQFGLGGGWSYRGRLNIQLAMLINEVSLTGSKTISIHAERLQISDAPRKQKRRIN